MMVLLPMHSDTEKGIDDSTSGHRCWCQLYHKAEQHLQIVLVSLVAFLAAHDLVDIVPPQI